MHKTSPDVLYRMQGHDICGVTIASSSLMDLKRPDFPLIVAAGGSSFAYYDRCPYLLFETSVWSHESNVLALPLNAITCKEWSRMKLFVL